MPNSLAAPALDAAVLAIQLHGPADIRRCLLRDGVSAQTIQAFSASDNVAGATKPDIVLDMQRPKAEAR